MSKLEKFIKPKKFDKNLIVIGAGSGGLVAAYLAASLQAKVTLIESHAMGGDCLNSGCVPSKALIKSAKIKHLIDTSETFGIKATGTVDFQQVMQRVKAIIQAVAPHDSIERYTKLGVDVMLGQAILLSPWEVNITLQDGTTKILTAKSIILATGAKPFIPNIQGIQDSGYLTSDTLWDHFGTYKTASKKLVVMGGGPIGCELGQAFQRLGSHVTLIQTGSHLLPKEDKEAAQLVYDQFTADGIQVLLNTTVTRFFLQDGKKFLVATDKITQQEHVISYDDLICATGRKPNLSQLNLEHLGYTTTAPLHVNKFLQTKYANIYAVGDVIGPYQFTHTAAHQAYYATVNALFARFKKFAVDYSVIPRTTFTDPEIAQVGLTAEEIHTRYSNTTKDSHIIVTRINFSDLDRSIVETETQGFIKVVTTKQGVLLGATIVGSMAGELLPEFTLAMKHKLNLNKILHTIHAYPTRSEGIKSVAGAWKRNITSQSALKILAWYHKFGIKK